MAGADFLGGDAEEGLGGDIIQSVPVWRCNWSSVEIFEACEISIISTGMSCRWQGIGAQEIESALRLAGKPRADWPDLAEDVRFMGRAVSAALNERQRLAERR